MFIPLFLVESLSSDEPLGIVSFGYNLLGSMIILLVILLVVDFGEILFSVSRYFVTERNKELNYVSLLSGDSKPKALIALVLYCILLTVSLVLSYQQPQVINTDIMLSKFPACLSGYKIVLITDVHCGPLVGKTQIEKLVELVNSLDADVVLLGGDMIDGVPDQIGSIADPFENLKSVDGVYYAVGNHEYLHGSSGPAWQSYFKNLGIHGLNNSRVSLPVNSSCGSFDLLGVDDFMGFPSMENATAGRDIANASILLAHQPNFSTQAKGKNIDLQLSGHTHAGQIWPLHMATLLGNTYFAGVYHQPEGSQVYVSQGAVGWGPRTRFLSANNIEVITLRRGPPDANPPVHFSVIWAFLAFPFAGISLIFCCFCGGPARRFIVKDESLNV